MTIPFIARGFTAPLSVPDPEYRRPLISVRGENGDEIEFTGVGSGWTLKPGSTGLGVPPRAVSTAARMGGGSILRSVRDTEREVFLPVDVHFGYGPEKYGELEDARRRIEAVCTGEVEIRVRTRTRTVSAFGWLTEGLEGAFTVQDVNGFRMNLALKFLCPEQWWFGQEVTESWSLSTTAKPLVTSKQIPFLPVIVAPSQVAAGVEVQVRGDAPVAPVWRVQPPGRDLRIESLTTGERIIMTGEITAPIEFDAPAGDIRAPGLTRGELWDRLTPESTLFELRPGSNSIKVAMDGATTRSHLTLSYRERFRAAH